MNKLFRISQISLILLTFVLSSCQKKNGPEKPVEEEVRTVVIDASKYESWQYFSFKKGEVVNVTDPANDLNWDIALHRYDFKTNGGKSGKGKGAVAETQEEDISKSIPFPDASSFISDEMGSITVEFKMGSSKKEKQPLNYVLTTKQRLKMKDGKPVMGNFGPIFEVVHKGAIYMDISVMPPNYELSKKVYFVRLANGKHVRMLVDNFRNDKGKTGHITIKYVLLDR